jgi:hypothetical protein
MSMNQEPLERSIITTPEARLEWTTTGKWDMYLLYDQAHYSQLSTSDGWWHRTLVLHPHHWLRLSGSGMIEPWKALESILSQPDRSSIMLPPLLVALFLAHSTNPEAVEQRQLFQWTAYAVREVLPLLPVSNREAGWHHALPDQLDHLSTAILDALLNEDLKLPWPLIDGIEAQILTHMADVFWTFPPALTRRIPQIAASYFEQCLEDGQEWLEDEDSNLENDGSISITPWSLLGNLGAMRFWRQPWPSIRGLSIQAPMREILFIWYQALIIMHPDAPIIDNGDLTWLCDGVLGGTYDGPFDTLYAFSAHIEALSVPLVEKQAGIAALEQESTNGTFLPSGRWELAMSSNWPIRWTFGIATSRLVAGPDGVWVRLVPAQQSWGSVLWWRPHRHPPACWSIALGGSLNSVQILALHESLWHQWRDLRVYGRLINGNAV